MTGGGSGGQYIPPIRKRVTVSCEMLVVVTVLMQPDKDVLAILNVGAVLSVHKNGESLFAMYGDRVAGYIEAIQNSEIIKCMEAGTFYVAEIKELEGMTCKVEIHAMQL